MNPITEEQYDDAENLRWEFIFAFRDADESELGGAEEFISMQLREVTSLAWYLGKQSMSVA